MMKTSWGNPVHVIAFCRTLLIVLAVAVGTVAAEDLEALRKKAEAGDATAQSRLGWMYDTGRGVAADYAEAAKWFRMAAEQGHADAQYKLGVMYRERRIGPIDDAVAFKWFRKAAEQDNASAQFNLGWRCAKGSGVPKDEAEAVPGGASASP